MNEPVELCFALGDQLVQDARCRFIRCHHRKRFVAADIRAEAFLRVHGSMLPWGARVRRDLGQARVPGEHDRGAVNAAPDRAKLMQIRQHGGLPIHSGNMNDEVAAIRHDLARYRNLLALNRDERIRAVLRDMIADLERRLRALRAARPTADALP